MATLSTTDHPACFFCISFEYRASTSSTDSAVSSDFLGSFSSSLSLRCLLRIHFVSKKEDRTLVKVSRGCQLRIPGKFLLLQSPRLEACHYFSICNGVVCIGV